MQIIEAESHWSSHAPTAVALGTFDAMHLGHLAILKNAVCYARQHGIQPVVYLFRNLPRAVLTGRQIPHVASFEKRMQILEEAGIEIAVVENFTKAYQELSYIDFVQSYLAERFRAQYISVGYNYHFGRGGEGNTEKLKKACAPYGIQVEVAPCVSLEEPVSSTFIRSLVADGEMETAARYLGRWFSVSGEVVYGNGLGRGIGFPTANLALTDDCITPKYGVYLTFVIRDGVQYPAITNVGMKPTVERNYPCIETHLMHFDRDLYGRRIEVHFCRYLRDTVKFAGMDALRAQLERDKAACLDYFQEQGLVCKE